MTNEKKTTAVNREELKKEVEYMENILGGMQKEINLKKKKYAIMEDKYNLTEQGQDSAQMEYQLDPEYRAVALEIDKLNWDMEIAETQFKLDQQQKLLKKKKELLKARK